MRLIVIIFLLISVHGTAQSVSRQILVLGNHKSVCGIDSSAVYRDSLPENLDSFHIVLLFSNAESKLSNDEINQLLRFVEKGGGLYCGSENWPLQAESNQFTNEVYKKQSFGNYHQANAESAGASGNLSLDTLEYIPAGNTTVAFPLDYRLNVEAWVEDEPLILSGKIGEGRVIIDGGYSRFYCASRNEITDRMFRGFILYLSKTD